MSNILFLAAKVARSSAYAQALAKSGTTISSVLIMTGDASSPGRAATPPSWKGESPVELPNLSTPLEETCAELSTNLTTMATKDVNSSKVLTAVRDTQPDLVIYSGFGGQIVSKELLKIAPFLHVHSGWLPDFRGSTTLYYSLLEKNECGVSAMLINEKIDLGGIIARKQYPAPPKGMDIDYLYDSAIRADLLLKALNAWQVSNGTPKTIIQEDNEGGTYYVIHPILKHLSCLTLEVQKDDN